MFLGALFRLLLLSTPIICAAPSGPWDQFNLAPGSRIVHPKAIHNLSGTVENAINLLANGSATLSGNGSYVTLDFGQEVGGFISLNFDEVTPRSSIALSFTESPLFISPLTSDDSAVQDANMSYDGVLPITAPIETTFYTMPSYRLRGGFRYLTLVSTSESYVTISNVSCAISFMPHVEDLRNYTGYFYVSDTESEYADFLTRLWYSGAYTVQTVTIAADTGRKDPPAPSPGWYNNATAATASPVVVDGAKRGRAVWSADMHVAVATEFVSTNDIIPSRNALSTLFSELNQETGQMPYSGPPLSEQGSDTYQAWTLIGTYDYVLYSGDLTWLESTWSNYTKALQFLANKVDSTGLLYVTGTGDWGRLYQGGYNSEANAIYYKALTNSADLANWLNYTTLAAEYATNALALKTRFNDAFWSDSKGMYRDNLTSTLYPQDANSLAVIFNLTTSMEQASSISEGLTRHWNEYGSVAPELPDTIAPFIGGFELAAHFVSGNDARAMELLRLEWGYMLNTSISVQSTLLEGYTSNGSLYFRSTDGYDYDASFTSHSHGWSSGPTASLTFYVLGLTVTSPQGETWSVAPHTSGLSSVQGGFETPLGWFGVEWSSDDDTFNMTISTPEGTNGVVFLPTDGAVLIDGSEYGDNSTLLLDGGNHTILVQSR
ncbi:glycoside hydrolase family 78 protein [Wolfiporia cocos MD-104 SS10]|uniref:Glycoside hydrolase family 78 protein n=1 Tax=Wolfiporia cocos (strain MD-104) TaxID=742152 RepID=A0A2H3JL83_WOLCO|nr:glycoside hydrolase family 78 protein [Wolfiporia cocos MD-104 SS10]